jgi:hypothetical protein
MTSGNTFPQRLTEIDDLARPDHWYLTPEDNCYFLGEYTARKGFAFSATNQLVLNFKKSMDKRGTPEWWYKDRAIDEVAVAFRTALPEAWLNILAHHTRKEAADRVLLPARRHDGGDRCPLGLSKQGEDGLLLGPWVEPKGMVPGFAGSRVRLARPSSDRQFLNRRRRTPEFGARTAAGSLEAVFESSDVERFAWILMAV